MNFIEWLKKKQQEEKQKQQQQQKQENEAYDKIMSAGAGSEKYKAKKEVRKQNQTIKAQNDEIKRSNKKLQSDLAAQADKQGMSANEKMYYIQTQYVQKENKTKVPYKSMRDYRSEQIDFVDKDLNGIMKNDPEAKKKIEAGNALNVYLNGGQTHDETIALGEGWNDTYMTQFRDDLNPEELKKLSYLLGDQEISKTDHSQTIKDYTKTIEYRAGQAHEDKKYASGDYKTGNFYLNSAAQGAVSNTVGGFNKFIKRLTGDITPTVTIAEEKAYRKELSEAEGFKRIAGLSINSAAQMATSGGMGGMFVSVAGNTYDQSRKQGYNDSEALTYALINAGLETVTTKLGGKLLGGYRGFVKGVPEIKNVISNVVKNPIAQRCAFLITDMGAEGVEETLQTAVDPLIRNTVFKENNNLVLSGKDYLESFLVGSLSVGALHAKSTAIGLSTDVKTMNIDIKLPDGTYVGADVINRYFNGNATESDVKQIKQLGSSINEENMNSVLKRMDDIANVKMSKDTYGEMNKKTAGMSAYDKISYFNDVISSPEFKAHTQELMKTAQEQKKAKAGRKKGDIEDVSDIRQNAETGILNNTKNSIQEGNTVEVNNNDNTQNKTVSNINENINKEDVFDNVTLSSSQNNSIDTDNGLKENNLANDNAVSNLNVTNNKDNNQENEDNAVKNISNVNSDGSYGKENTNSSQGIANGDEIGYKEGEGELIQKTKLDIATKLSNEILNSAQLIESKVTKDMKSLEINGAHLEGLDFKLKSNKSLTRKIILDANVKGVSLEEAAANIGDSLRYTLVTDDSNYSMIVNKSLDKLQQQGYIINKLKNYWGDDIYQGINVRLTTPQGIVMELQFHTQASYYTKEVLNHKYYEIARSEISTIDEIMQATNIMIQNQSKVTVPIDAKIIKSLGGY